MKRGFKIFSLFLLILLVLCSFSSVNADDTILADGVVESNNENIVDALESDKSIDDDLSNACIVSDDNFATDNTDISIDSDSNQLNHIESSDESRDESRDESSDESSDESLDDNLGLSYDIDGKDKNLLLSSNENTDSLAADLNENSLGAYELSFHDLGVLIGASLSLGHIDLTSDYKFNYETDAVNIFGLVICPSTFTVFDGHGHYIDGNFQAGIFHVFTDPYMEFRPSITFQNVIFKNVGFSEDMMDCYEEQAPPGEVENYKKVFNAVRASNIYINFYNCKFISNNCPVNGALSLRKKTNMIMQNCSFESNQATHGAAITMDTSCHFDISNCHFINNNAKEDGAAIYVQSSILDQDDSDSTLHHCTFIGNTALYNGGAIAVERSSSLKVRIIEGYFSLNVAGESGGALYIDSSVELIKSNLTNNRALRGGGAYLSYFNSPTSQTSFINNRFVNNDANELASELYINFQTEENHYSLNKNYFKNSQTFIPSLYLATQYPSEMRLEINHNSFVPMDLGTYTFMKIENISRCEINENWWGKNNPHLDSSYEIEVNGMSYKCSIDRSPLYLRMDVPLEIPNLQESELRFGTYCSKNGEDVEVDFFPFGIDISCSSSDGVVRVGDSTHDANFKSAYFTPRHNGTARLKVKFDKQSIDYTLNVIGRNSEWKKIFELLEELLYWSLSLRYIR